MADGTWHGANDAQRLGQVTAGRSTLWARCCCGEEAVLDPKAWLGQGLAGHPLRLLEERLRCRCGARRGSLQIRGLTEAPQSTGGGIYIFR